MTDQALLTLPETDFIRRVEDAYRGYTSASPDELAASDLAQSSLTTQP